MRAALNSGFDKADGARSIAPQIAPVVRAEQCSALRLERGTRMYFETALICIFAGGAR